MSALRPTQRPQPQVTPGSLARVRADAPSRFRGRTGLVLGVEHGVAILRFGPSRGYEFAVGDLVPIVNVSARGRQR